MLKKAIINGRVVDIQDVKSVIAAPTEANNMVAIEDNGYVLPLRGATDKRPGVYRAGSFYMKTVFPSEADKEEYISTDKNTVDFSQTENIRDIISAQSKLRNLENSRLTTVDNIFYPADDPNDAPEMLGLKEAVRRKSIDLDKYEARFGPNYNNDKRLFDKPSITLAKIKTMANALDMKVTLTFEDKSPDVPNPMNSKVSVVVSDEQETDTQEDGE